MNTPNTELSFRRSKPIDFNWLLELRRDKMNPHLIAAGFTPEEQTHRDAVQTDFGDAMILQLNGADIGVIKVIKTTKPWHFRHIQIAPEFQARGLGTIALNRMLEKLPLLQQVLFLMYSE